MNPKILVVIPYYNDSKHIRSAIKSIKDQTYKNQVNIIVWNDGSSPEEAKILESIEGIVVHHNERNLGIVKTLNRSLDFAYENKYDFYFRLDSDDKSMPSRIKNTLFAMQRASIDIFSSNRTQSDGITTNFPSSNKEIKRCLIEFNPITHSSVCFNLKTISRKDLVYDEKYIHAEDFSLWRKLAKLGYRFYNSPEALVDYYINPRGLTATHREEQEKSVRRVIREIHLDL